MKADKKSEEKTIVTITFFKVIEEEEENKKNFRKKKETHFGLINIFSFPETERRVWCCQIKKRWHHIIQMVKKNH